MYEQAELLNSGRRIFRAVLFALHRVSGTARGCVLLNLSGVRQKEVENLQSRVLREHLREAVNGSTRSGD